MRLISGGAWLILVVRDARFACLCTQPWPARLLRLVCGLAWEAAGPQVLLRQGSGHSPICDVVRIVRVGSVSFVFTAVWFPAIWVGTV